MKFNAHGGGFVLGRSDATLNRYGIRIGNAGICPAMDGTPEVTGSLILWIKAVGKRWRLPAPLRATAQRPDPERRPEIHHDQTRVPNPSPRHVPGDITQPPEIRLALPGK